jgi:hypothetical protein
MLLLLISEAASPATRLPTLAQKKKAKLAALAESESLETGLEDVIDAACAEADPLQESAVAECQAADTVPQGGVVVAVDVVAQSEVDGVIHPAVVGDAELFEELFVEPACDNVGATLVAGLCGTVVALYVPGQPPAGQDDAPMSSTSSCTMIVPVEPCAALVPLGQAGDSDMDMHNIEFDTIATGFATSLRHGGTFIDEAHCFIVVTELCVQLIPSF